MQLVIHYLWFVRRKRTRGHLMLVKNTWTHIKDLMNFSTERQMVIIPDSYIYIRKGFVEGLWKAVTKQ